MKALLIVDMITDFDFDDGEKLYGRSRSVIDNLSSLRERFQDNGFPVIYVNDDLEGRIENAAELYRKVCRSESGVEVLSRIGPKENDKVFLKPQRSGFYKTDLNNYLTEKKVTDLTVAGLTTDICVLFTAHDAYMRKLNVRVPGNCSAAVKQEFHDDALEFLRRVAKADIRPVSSAKPDTKAFAKQGGMS